MEYSSDKKMTRKEYLKSKKKGKFGIRIIKYTLLLVVIVLLGIYLFKQLNIYNNVTKMANKVVEESALVKTMKLYYIADGYTKDARPELVLYNASDNSRTKIPDTEGITNIEFVDGYIYGTINGTLYKINLETNEKTMVISENVDAYIVKEDKIFFYSDVKDSKKDGIYIYDISNGDKKQIINININQMVIDNSNIYVISKGKTEKSIIKYNLNGSGRTILTNKEIVNYMIQDNDNIYFVSNNKLYSMKKDGKELGCIADKNVYVDSNVNLKTTAVSAVAVKNNNVYYITNGEKAALNQYNKPTGTTQIITKKNVESLQIIDNILYYKLNNSTEIYRANLETGKTEKMTSIRGNEYIWIN